MIQVSKCNYSDRLKNFQSFWRVFIKSHTLIKVFLYPISVYTKYIDWNTSIPISSIRKIGKITSDRQGLYKFYFPRGVFKDNEKNILQVLRQETAGEILMFIIEGKNPTQTDIANSIGISAASVNWHVKHLIILLYIIQI